MAFHIPSIQAGRIRWRFGDGLAWRFLFRPKSLTAATGEAIEVASGTVNKVEAVLHAPDRYRDLPEPAFPRFGVVQSDDPNWPAVIIRVGGAWTEIVARVASVPVADEIAGLLDRLEDDEARKPKSPAYWNRGI